MGHPEIEGVQRMAIQLARQLEDYSPPSPNRPARVSRSQTLRFGVPHRTKSKGTSTANPILAGLSLRFVLIDQIIIITNSRALDFHLHLFLLNRSTPSRPAYVIRNHSRTGALKENESSQQKTFVGLFRSHGASPFRWLNPPPVLSPLLASSCLELVAFYPLGGILSLTFLRPTGNLERSGRFSQPRPR